MNRISTMLLVSTILTGCSQPEEEQPTGPLAIGGFTVELGPDDGTFTITHTERGDSLRDVRLLGGTGSATIEMQFGSFKFSDPVEDLEPAEELAPGADEGESLLMEIGDGSGEGLGRLTFRAVGDDTLWLQWSSKVSGANRAVLEAACDAEDHFMGLGSHAMDVDHVGQAFGLWVSEPSIGKTEDEEYPEDWYFTGTRHASSYPYPFLLRPHQAHGLLANTSTRVEVDLCASDPDRFSVDVWSGDVDFWLFSGDGPLEVVQRATEQTGRLDLPAPWIFAPWNDAVRGPDRVRAVASLLRESGAPSSVIWSEDWKGAEETAFGYHLEGEWFLDEETYPDAVELAAELEADGFKWFAYFSPFVIDGTETWDQAVADDVLIHRADGNVYTFPGVTFEDTSLVDLSNPDARDWARGRMEAALEFGFDGWMADYAEWLPTDAVLASGEDALTVHNTYTVEWQALNDEVLGEEDAAFFSRSGWVGAAGLAPVVWAGDQRTSFDSDDGLPTVIPLGLGLSACGVPVYTHDVAGYQSVGNPPSDKELWFRWASLGAFSPILRTHHGAFEEDNWQFDSDEETTAYWAEVARQNMRIFPYRYGLARRAADQGTPMVLPVAFLHGEDWGRTDAWMLGDALLVAPVTEAGVEGREVDLPEGIDWYDWSTRSPASSGWKEAALDEIPVFAASGTTVPVFDVIPDTLVEGVDEGVTTLADADGSRTVYLFGGGGAFTEGDGTTYTPSGTPTGAGQIEATLTSGSAEVAGVRVEIEGTVERTYTLVVVD